MRLSSTFNSILSAVSVAHAAPEPVIITELPHPPISTHKVINNSTFPNGDAWSRITYGVSEENQAGRVAALDYPQNFNDGKRLLAGPRMFECSAKLASGACSPDQVHVYPIRWKTAMNVSGIGGAIRELRIRPNNEHLGFNSFTYHDFPDDGANVPVETEQVNLVVTSVNPSPTGKDIDWVSDFVQTGPNDGTKKTSPDGLRLTTDLLMTIFQANGILTTTINGEEWLQPANGIETSRWLRVS
ncbi:hypothetical protein CORC01_03937 [Colletotrichum orchidophilum]|uniref:Uncharacterized protein n=1 Tax=Colletotrichum orchidophilum TaxID=1209926 RepID=A0A1G4BHQ1_9PEZI|nr:uncharacterized protein CORC01_03937 [Colletotrichum orchidophilum]OHF00863.1 hypothetical protein CORC01_03937 [Colletotrichum orchidophilum]